MIVRTSGSQKDSQTIELGVKQPELMHYNVPYDSCQPEETIREFIAAIRKMIFAYEHDKVRIGEIELEFNDLLHYAEIAAFKNVPEGYKVYRRIAELRRERRACKSEIDLLQPVYEHFHATEVLNKLSNVQGEVAKAKSAIDMRTYLVRTSVLAEWLNKPEPETTVSAPDISEVIEEPDGDEPEETPNDIAEQFMNEAKEQDKKYKLAWKRKAQ